MTDPANGVRRVAPDRLPDAAEDVSRHRVRVVREHGSVTGPAAPSLGPSPKFDASRSVSLRKPLGLVADLACLSPQRATASDGFLR